MRRAWIAIAVVTIGCKQEASKTDDAKARRGPPVTLPPSKQAVDLEESYKDFLMLDGRVGRLPRDRDLANGVWALTEEPLAPAASRCRYVIAADLLEDGSSLIPLVERAGCAVLAVIGPRGTIARTKVVLRPRAEVEVGVEQGEKIVSVVSSLDDAVAAGAAEVVLTRVGPPVTLVTTRLAVPIERLFADEALGFVVVDAAGGYAMGSEPFSRSRDRWLARPIADLEDLSAHVPVKSRAEPQAYTERVWAEAEDALGKSFDDVGLWPRPEEPAVSGTARLSNVPVTTLVVADAEAKATALLEVLEHLPGSAGLVVRSSIGTVTRHAMVLNLRSERTAGEPPAERALVVGDPIPPTWEGVAYVRVRDDTTIASLIAWLDRLVVAGCEEVVLRDAIT